MDARSSYFHMIRLLLLTCLQSGQKGDYIFPLKHCNKSKYRWHHLSHIQYHVQVVAGSITELNCEDVSQELLESLEDNLLCINYNNTLFQKKNTAYRMYKHTKQYKCIFYPKLMSSLRKFNDYKKEHHTWSCPKITRMHMLFCLAYPHFSSKDQNTGVGVQHIQKEHTG